MAATRQDPMPLWDRLFAPLVAAGTGAITMQLLADTTFSIDLPEYRGFRGADLITASIVSVVAAVLVLAAVYAFPHLHRLIHRLPTALLMLVAGGVVLGVLGAIGGEVTLFKGLAQTNELVATRSTYTDWELVVIVVVKLLALTIASAAGFRGGRIFPTVFVGAAVGVLANALAPSMPLALSVAAGVFGATLAVSQLGYLALFVAALIVGDVRMVAILCIVIVPTWLVVSGRPPMQALPAPGEAHGTTGAASG
jgi:H+/Cl- antiporter ClcA